MYNQTGSFQTEYIRSIASQYDRNTTDISLTELENAKHDPRDVVGGDPTVISILNSKPDAPLNAVEYHKIGENRWAEILSQQSAIGRRLSNEQMLAELKKHKRPIKIY